MIMRHFGMAVGLAAIAFFAMPNSPGIAAEIHGGVHPVPAVILQVIKAFDNPEAAIFSADGNHVFDPAETFG